jgi:hypothetical protein
MKTILNISVLILLLFAAPSQCCAMMVIEDVSKARAKELGVEVRSKMIGTNAVYVWLEFKTKGELKDFQHAQLEITAGERSVVSATLLPDRPSPDSVVVFFSADPATMPTCTVWIVVGRPLYSRA